MARTGKSKLKTSIRQKTDNRHCLTIHTTWHIVSANVTTNQFDYRQYDLARKPVCPPKIKLPDIRVTRRPI